MRIELVDRRNQLLLVAREVLRPPAVAREDDRAHIGRPQPIDDVARDAARGHDDVQVVPRDVHVVEHDREEAAVADLIGEIVVGDVGRHVPHPRGRRRVVRGRVDFRDGDDALRLAFLVDGEVLAREAVNRLAVLVEHRDVETDDVRTDAENRLLRGWLGLLLGRLWRRGLRWRLLRRHRQDHGRDRRGGERDAETHHRSRGTPQPMMVARPPVVNWRAGSMP